MEAIVRSSREEAAASSTREEAAESKVHEATTRGLGDPQEATTLLIIPSPSSLCIGDPFRSSAIFERDVTSSQNSIVAFFEYCNSDHSKSYCFSDAAFVGGFCSRSNVRLCQELLESSPKIVITIIREIVRVISYVGFFYGQVLHNIAIAEYFHWNMLRNAITPIFPLDCKSLFDFVDNFAANYALKRVYYVNYALGISGPYNNMGNALKDAGHVEEAINFYRSCLALQPNHPQALSSLGNIYMDCNMMSVAASFYKATLAVTTGISAPFNNLAIIYKQQTAADGLVNRRNTFKEIGRVTEAIQDYIRAVNIRPTMPEAHANLASAYKDRFLHLRRTAPALAIFSSQDRPSPPLLFFQVVGGGLEAANSPKVWSKTTNVKGSHWPTWAVKHFEGTAGLLFFMAKGKGKSKRHSNIAELDDHVDVAKESNGVATLQRVGSSPQPPHAQGSPPPPPPPPVEEVETLPEVEEQQAPAPNTLPDRRNDAVNNARTNQLPKKQDWARLFKNNRKTKLAMDLDQYKAKGERLDFRFEDINNVEDAMGFCLSGWVVYKFDKDEDRQRVLQGGPYFAFGVLIFLKIMPKCFMFDEDGRFMPVWIQIHGLPPNCWRQLVLSKIGSEVGKPLYTDNLTRTRERLEYARLMVEIPAIGEHVREVPITLPTGVQVDLKIIYEMVPDFCQTCNKLGHRSENYRGKATPVGQ
ncbi:hypothetical protein ZIOFF_038915 [Zingiber officinale]|uniref:Uncharacterized protein n=1 Tax=Zingiber officinale TaxID=94328 RepID=A0A8J5GAH8_ZINOF|nr:hypothetical protein ZIOFF_038915 [Zingiber officinale]